ncbi:hypothetical protein [Alteromonas sp. 009811495]|uniref:hypothetical protein n=1 Tax=Alteromonas sp. 009811495 TaxID=3002962 RepID=UPI00237DA5D8|nr:hypothetical protein [Alteromonas sp. 009811495]WDT87703.1 hypothetical protein OZ660_08210 [Alteromonas sp. 009811495]
MKKALVIVVAIVVAALSWFAYLSSDADKRDQQAAEVPLITVMEILHASDLQAGVKTAVKEKNTQAIEQWLEQAVNVGEAANLSKQDLDYLKSETAKDYVVFNAKRQLYNEAFEARYYSLEEVESLKQQYPEAKDLFPRTDALIEKRDAIIEQMAKTLSGSNTVDDLSLNKAKQQWREQAENLEQ